MHRAAAALIHTRAQMGRSTTVGDVEYFLGRMERDTGTVEPRHCTMHNVKARWHMSELVCCGSLPAHLVVATVLRK